MKGEDILTALGQVDEKFLEEIDRIHQKKTRVGKRIVVAASLCILAISSLFLGKDQMGEFFSRNNPNEPQTTPLVGKDEKRENLPKLKIANNAGDGFGFAGVMAYRIEELEEDNPWKEENKINSLPLFTNKYSFKKGTFIVTGYTIDEMKRDLSDIVKKYGLDFDKDKIRISRYNEVGEEKIPQKDIENLAESISYESKDYIFQVDQSGRIRVKFKQVQFLGDFKAKKDESSEEILRQMGEAFIRDYPNCINFENPKIRIVNKDYGYEGERSLLLEIYKGRKEDKEEFLQYHLGPSIRIYFEKDNSVYAIDYFNNRIGEKLGDYPLISPQEAREKMKDGAFVTSVPYPFPGEDKIAKIELVYWTSPLEPYLIPYYKVYVELEEEDLELENGLKTFGLYYVPAVENKYIENIPTYQGDFD